MIAANDVLHGLLTMVPQQTVDAPKTERGIYGLVDHNGELSYIGSTMTVSESFYKRIHARHRTGSEGYSHYFSKVYNTGRMWRDPRYPTGDAAIAKRFRIGFIAEFCRAVWFSLDVPPDEILATELAVIRHAPPRARLWNSNTTIRYDEPSDLIDSLMARLGTSQADRAAMERQRNRSVIVG